jgi:CubicO group peptidase (beta-lactamase class C family)
MKKYFQIYKRFISNKIKIRILIISIFIIIANLNIINAREIGSIHRESKNINMDNLIFDLKIKSLMFLGSYPSLSICAIENNNVLWYKSYGYADIYKKIKPDENTIYIIGSISKTITSIAIMQLYEQDFFNLDDDINNYLSFSLRNPNYPDIPITFRMLLSHRSSIYDYHLYSRQGIIELAYYFPMAENLCDIVNELFIPGGSKYHSECWLNSKPGETTAYSSFGILVLSYLVEKISGLSIEEYCYKNIFEPLNMDNTFFHPSINNTNNIAIPYIRIFRMYIPLPHFDTKCLCSMGGLHTSVKDLSHLLIALMNNGEYEDVCILKESSVNEMINTIYSEEVFYSHLPHVYGLGIWSTDKFGERLFGHGGGNPGYLCDMYWNLTTKRGFIMFSNHCNPGCPTNNLARLRIYPKFHIIRTKLGETIMNKINNNLSCTDFGGLYA